MGILHGMSGQWLLNATSSPSLAYYAISNFRNISCKSSCCVVQQLSRLTDVTCTYTGPTRLNFIAILNAASSYLNETWEAKWQQHTIGSLGQAIVILAPLAQLSESDQQTSLKLLKEIKHLHPGNKTFAFLSSCPFAFRNSLIFLLI